MLVKALPRMIRYLKDRGIYVLFNTNGTLLSPKKHQPMIDTGLDELRVSLDAADAKTFLRPCAARISSIASCAMCASFTELQRETGATSPRVSLWLTGLKETIEQLPAFVRLAASMGVREVYLQRLVYDEAGYGLARSESSLFEAVRAAESRSIEAAAALAGDLGITLDASGATEPGLSLTRQDDDAALVGVPAAVVADVFHRAWPCAAVLHGAVLRARLRQLHAGRRHAADAARDLERRGLSGVPCRTAQRCAAASMRGMRYALESCSHLGIFRDS